MPAKSTMASAGGREWNRITASNLLGNGLCDRVEKNTVELCYIVEGKADLLTTKSW